ncbi:MAG: prolipoprotein diacylglyceryl transferase [Pseudomonadota bacterium]|nr:prolipoprotein diacylglyceryl transferase [Pseudomonadota bacterium]
MVFTHHINPVAFTIFGYIQIRWYGLAYLAGFICAWLLGKSRLKEAGLNKDQFVDLLSQVAFGLLIGGRLGYMILYKTQHTINHPLSVLQIWEGGMSFHGGIIGGMVALLLYCRKHNLSTYKLMDFIGPLIPPGLFFGRLGNFINGELWGRPTGHDWGVIFPMVDQQPRHPSQLYEMIGEGMLLFWLMSHHQSKAQSNPHTTNAGIVFCYHYAWIRFLIEFMREPDYDIGYLGSFSLTMGQILSLAMLAVAILVNQFPINSKKTATELRTQK